MELSPMGSSGTPARRRIDRAAWELARAQHPPPLPLDEYTLGQRASHDSPLAGRLCFLLGEEDASQPETGPSILFDTGISRIWTNVQYFREAGPAVMCETQVFLGALRRLTDRCLMAIGATSVVRVGASDTTQVMIQSLYPDATIVHGAPRDIDMRRPIDANPGPVRRSHPVMAFVLGSGRSGTTWLTRMLQLHPLVAGLGDAESWIFDLLAPLWRLRAEGWLGHLAESDLADYVGEFTDTLIDAARDKRDRSSAVFVEKTPNHAYQIPFLRAVYPQARYLHLVRDGRDVARSLSQMRFTTLPDSADAATNWERTIRAVRAGVTGLPPMQFREVRYEEVRADPPRELEHLWHWLGLSADDKTRSLVAEMAGERVSTWSGVDVPLGSESWRSLPRSELARIYARIGKVLVAEGYVTSSELRRWKRNPSYLVARVVRLPATVVHRLHRQP